MSKTNSFASYLSLGVDPDLPDYLQYKIRLSNWVSACISGLMVLYSLLVYIYIRPLFPFTFSAVLIYASLPFLSSLNLSGFSRLLLATVLPLTTFLLHIGLVPAGQLPIAAITTVQTALLVLPWVVFDTREKIHLIISFAIGLLLIFMVQSYSSLFEPEINRLSESASLMYFSYLTGCGFAAVSLYLLQRTGMQSEVDNASLAAEMKSQQAAFKLNQEKLNKYIEEVEQTQQANLQRQWASDGLALFAEILRKQDTVHLYDTLIEQLVKYLKANQGGLFLLREESGEIYIELVACYAYERKKFINKRLEKGQSLVGQCILEGDTIFLTEIPQDYLQITSGLGTANPSCLILIPMKVNDVVEGVIELAAFHTFKPHEVEFLHKISESIGSSVINVKVNQRTHQLLEKSRIQTEEMHAQSEEMRQNIEELEATQEEMRRIQERLQVKDKEKQQTVEELTAIRIELESQLTHKLLEAESQKARMEVFLKTATDAIIFMDDKGCITSCNDACETMFSYKTEELIGKSLDILVQIPSQDNLIAFLKESMKVKRTNWVEYTAKSKLYGFQFPVEISLSEGQVSDQCIYVAMVRDISKRKKAESEVQKNLSKFQELQQNMRDAQQKMNTLKAQVKEKEDLLLAKEEEIKTLKN